MNRFQVGINTSLLCLIIFSPGVIADELEAVAIKKVDTVLGATVAETELEKDQVDEERMGFDEVRFHLRTQKVQGGGVPANVDWSKCDVKLVETWEEPACHYPLLGPAKLKHRLFKCSLKSEFEDVAIDEQVYIHFNYFLMVESNSAGLDQDVVLDVKKGKRSYRKKTHFGQRREDLLRTRPEHATEDWPEYMQGTHRLTLASQVDQEGNSRSLTRDCDYEAIVSGSNLFLFQRSQNILVAFQLISKDDESDNDQSLICYADLWGTRRLLRVSPNELVFLSRSAQPMTTGILSKCNFEEKRALQKELNELAFLVADCRLRFRGIEVAKYKNLLNYPDDMASLQASAAAKLNGKARSAVWFVGDAESQREMEAYLSSTLTHEE